MNLATILENPDGPDLPEWPAFTENDQKVMVFDAGPSARPVPNLDRLEAFDAYFAWLSGTSE